MTIDGYWGSKVLHNLLLAYCTFFFYRKIVREVGIEVFPEKTFPKKEKNYCSD